MEAVSGIQVLLVEVELRGMLVGISCFSKFFGDCSNNEAELQAVVEGLRHCQQLGVTDIDVECDSVVVVAWIFSKNCTVWYLWDFWDQLRSLLEGFDYSIKHLYR